MKLEILGAYGGNADQYRLTSLLVNGCLALDAGCLTSALPFERQLAIRDVVVSHAHADHVGTLPYLIDNLFGYIDHPLVIHGSKAVIDALRAHIFNEIIWPDFSRLPSPRSPSLLFRVIEPEVSFQLGRLRIRAIPVNHLVPCTGFLVESLDQAASILYTADTTTTDRIWDIANEMPTLRAVIVDCSFPNRMEDLARASGHMTPKMLAADLAKLKRVVPILVYHLKPSFETEMAAELDDLHRQELDYRIQGRIFDFSG
jgi:cAMP phosphodiesterase